MNAHEDGHRERTVAAGERAAPGDPADSNVAAQEAAGSADAAEFVGPILSAEADDSPTEFQTPVAWVAFAPSKIGLFRDRFQLLARQLGAHDSVEAARKAVHAEQEWIHSQHGAPSASLKYAAALSVLLDLLEQGWGWRYIRPFLQLAPPNFTTAPRSPGAVLLQKEAIRRSMDAERLAQLRVPSTRRFLAEMERPRRFGGRELSVLDLVADGEELARSLRAAQRNRESARVEAFEQVVQPYMQLIRGEARCDQSGYRLIDIWRFFRYTWSLPYFSTPGRNLFYLIRDAARAMHPVIGIAALGNSIVGLADRERWIGWTLEEIDARLQVSARDEGDGRVQSIATALGRSIEQSISQIDLTGLASPKEVAEASEKAMARLLEQAKASAEQRVAHLRAHEEGVRERPRRALHRRPPAGDGGRAAESEGTAARRGFEALFVQKRATDLAELLRAKAAFRSANVQGAPEAGLAALMATAESNPAWGQCAVTALIVQDAFGGELLRSTIGGIAHYWNRLDDGSEIDLTRIQFGPNAYCERPAALRSRDYVLSFPETKRRYEHLRVLVTGKTGR
jgi:Domain of unknown function (DUF4338)